MKILSPHKISTEIIDIIYESKEYLILVSPYVNLLNWDRLAIELINAKKRGVRIEFFVRNEPENSKSWEQLAEIGIKARLVSNLHAKLYFNEKNGIISSMNLLSSSNSNSIEIACKIDKKEELEDIKRFVKDFVKVNESSVLPSEDDLYLTKEKFIIILQNYIGHNLKSRTNIFYKNGIFQINTLSNQFFLNINKVDNLIEISAIVSRDEANFFENQKAKYFKSNYFDCRLHRGQGNAYDTIVAYSKVRLSNSFLDNLRVNEKKDLIREITGFLNDIDEIKNASYTTWRQTQ